VHLGNRHRWKPGIFGARQASASRDGVNKRIIFFEVTDASPQIAGKVQTDESSGTRGQFTFCPRFRLWLPGDRGNDRGSCHVEQHLLIRD